MKMHAARFAAIATVTGASMAWAHPGAHHDTSPGGIVHFLTQPSHVAPTLLVLTLGVGLGVALNFAVPRSLRRWFRRRT